MRQRSCRRRTARRDPPSRSGRSGSRPPRGTEEIISVKKDDVIVEQAEIIQETKKESIIEPEKPIKEEKAQTKKITADKQNKRVKTSEEKFLDSLPKPLEQKNKRIIDISPPKREKPTGENIRRYTSPEKGDSRQRPQRFDQTQSTSPYKKSTTAPARTNMFAAAPTKPPLKFGTATPSKPVKKKTDDNDKKEKGMNKRTLIRRGFETDMTLMGDEYNKMGSRKYKSKKKIVDKETPGIVIENATVNTEIIPIKTLSDKLGITAVDITKKLFKDGIIKTINETIDYETAALMAAEMGIELELKLDKTAEDKLVEFHEAEQSGDAEMKKRPPIVTVMGHVDHGKTSLLDAIKHSKVAEGEAGGITQQIGAYTIAIKGEQITFIDTPGHEAFTAMRARGASITDIAVLVVAADDGIMPQTVEAINHAKAADVPIIVAINKMDKPSANPDRIKQQLTEHGLVAEEWGGDTMICPVSAVKREGLDNLLETILLIAEVKELKADPDKKAKGTIIEAKLDKGKGPVATVLVQTGTLMIGDTVVAGICTGRIRAMIDDKGKNIKEAGPSMAVSVLGFSEVPNAGDPVYAMDNEKLSKLVAEERMDKIRTDMTKTSTMVTLDDVFEKIAEGQIKGLNIILKADLQGSVEAVNQALLKLSTSELKVSIIHCGVGAINESDVRLAQTVMAIIIGFNVRPEIKAKQLAERENVDIRLYRIIYDVIDDVEKALKGMLEPEFKEVQTGQAEVRNIFKITGTGTVAGCYVISGKIIKNAKIRLIRDGVVMTEGNISALKRFKDDAKEVAQGYECGISIENYNDIKENDIIESFIMEEIPQ
ncbi:MAG: translation initiation factor IF-2 [Clostridia bacterium]|nr:translation initiation factor IF-2 [Clostridia bacterium]